ncbi:CTB family bacteriocin [Desmonostoc muscorum LEGE 12446]|uniref:CTB family bacteriocin n=1 Tax=Desmonostoc muscorum LEGE 12446 TaxID=1828758 RepID=A0A8J7DE74_DESMC|nr:CTB family bacteriocin [Desmonostoc muscorum]MCF2145149.1 CTB family bacteriocin [Desmonostoc muscorum LEGE 12446]
MSGELFRDLSDEQLEIVAGGADFAINATFYQASENILSGSSYSGPDGSIASSYGRSTNIKTAGLAFLALDVNHILDFLQYQYK